MNTISLEFIENEPSSEDILLYPDFLIGRLIQNQIGKIGADRALKHDGSVDFVFTALKTGEQKVVGTIQEGSFRPLLALFGKRCGSKDMIYSGHTLFAVEHECEGQKRPHRFSLFVCNEPTMGIWMKLYFYCIDGIWPMRKEAA